jgi:dephospho-CoA kinase
MPAVRETSIPGPAAARLTVGLTGGLASGKSTVARWLAELGCTVIDADRVVADLYRPGANGAEAVRRLFGEDLLDVRGAVDHKKLGALVFGDPEARRRLEAAIHPLVGQRFAAILEEATGIVVMEATLLVETGGADRYDVVVTVEADPELRLRRAVERGVDPESARGRLGAQATTEARVAHADFVLWNEGSLDELRAQVEALHAELESRLTASARS